MTVLSMTRRLRWGWVTFVGCVILAGVPALAQLPVARLDAVYPAGGTPGKTVELSIYGNDLDDATQLQFSHPGITAAQKMAEPGPFDTGPQPVENGFVVTVRPDVPVGHYLVRALGKYGLSNARTFLIQSLDAQAEQEPNNEIKDANSATVPSAFDGQLNGGADQDWLRFTGQAGQRLLIEGYSHRIDSRANLRLTLYSTDGRILAESRRGRSGDPLIDMTLPGAGDYLLRIGDALHGGGVEFPYRVTLNTGPTIEFVFPPAGLPGSNDEYTVYGNNLPGGQPGPLVWNGRPLEQLTVRIPIPGDIAGRLQFSERLESFEYAADGVEFRLPSPQGPSNPILITAAAAPIVREQENNTPVSAQKLTPPCEVAGQFYPQRDQDWYAFEAKAGDTYWIEVWSHRLRLPTDPSLVIQRVARDDAGKEQVTVVAVVDDVDQRQGGREFDQRSYDPAYRFVAPADGTYRILVREGYSQLHHDPRLVYRLVIRPPEPDFRLVAVPIDQSGALLLRKGGREAIRVLAARRDGFDGEITVTAAGMPSGVTGSEVVIGPANHYSTLIISADANAAPSTGTIQISGKATIQGREVVRVARAGMALDPLPFNQPNADQTGIRSRLTDSIPITISTGESSRVVLALGDGKVIETARGGVIKIPYTVTRQEGAGGSITGFPIGLPPNIGVPQVGIGGNNSGEFELRLQSNTPPGTYSFYLAGMVQGVNYSRNPEAAAKAKERQEQLAKAVTETQQKLQQAQQTAQQAATGLNTANNEFNAATQAKASADQGLAEATNRLKAAMDSLAASKSQSAEKPDDAGLKQKVANDQKLVEDESAKLKSATEAAKTAETKLAEAVEKQKAAQDAKQKADADLQAAQQLLQRAQQEKQRIDQRAQQLAQQAALRGYNVNIPSPPVTLKIAEYPIRFAGVPERLQVPQGKMAEIPFKVERLYGFNADVTVQFLPPSGVGGLSVPNASLPANQTDGKLQLTAQPNATPGEHRVTLRVSLNFNGQGLTFDHPLVLVVDKVEPAAS